MSAAENEATQAARARGLQLGPVLLTLPATAAMLVFFVAPIAIFVVYSFLTAQLYDVARPFTLDAYSAALDSQLNRTLARNSIEIGLLVGRCSPSRWRCRSRTGCATRPGAGAWSCSS